MAALRSPSGSVIQASGRLEQRLIAQGWSRTDDPATPGARLITAADLDRLADTVANAVAESQTDRTDLRQIVEPMATEVVQLTATVTATTTQQAPKSTPRTDALEAWRVEAEKAIAELRAAIANVPAAVQAALNANPPPRK